MMDTKDILSAQHSVLGAILIEPKLMGEAMQEISTDDFTSSTCRTVWLAMAELFREGKPADVVSVRDKLTGFDAASKFLIELMEVVPSACFFEEYIKTMKRQASLARLHDIGAELHTAVDLDTALELLGKANAASIGRPKRTRRSARQMLESFARRHANAAVPDYLQWPIPRLNHELHSQAGDFIIIGGYPSDGKTAFALSCAWHQASSRRVGFYSLETNEDKIEDRSLAAIAGINMASIKHNDLTDQEWEHFATADAVISEWPIDVIPAAGMTVDDIRADALANRYQIIYIDYLQLITPAGKRWGNRTEEVSGISIALHQLSQSTGITVIALSQMTRPAASTSGTVPAPTMHNLRESGQIEQDADAIMLIYRLDQDNIHAPRRLNLAKNKEGQIGVMTLEFDGRYQRFRYVES